MADFRPPTCYSPTNLTESSPTTSPKGISRTRLLVAAITLLALWFVLCRHLAGEWSVNEQYSYGWFVPFFTFFLFWLRWEDRPEREVGGRRSEVRRQRVIAVAIGIGALVLLLPIRLFEIANPDWRPLGWLHTASVATITLLVIWFVGGRPWLRHFAFPIAFFFVAVPWISPIEEPIVQGLMRVVAAVATETITLCGVPAQLEGNLIRVNTGLVGVNEACSGVRSLQTSLMIGLLFGELKRFSLAKRFALLGGALAIAILANFGRAFFLVWVAASRGVPAVAGWHDFAGYAIVAVVFLGLLGLAKLLGGGDRARESKDANHVREPFSIKIPVGLSVVALIWMIVAEAGAEAWYRTHEKNLAARSGWSVRPPDTAPGYREIKIEEGVRQTLRFDQGFEAMWRTSDAAAPGFSGTNYLFFFRWNPGSSSVLRARAHRPDICLPSAGWSQIADRGTKTYLARGEISIAARHVVFRQNRGNAVAHTFFCLQEDKINPNEPRPDLQMAGGIQPGWSMEARVRVVRNGIRNQGQQVLEVVLVTSPPMDDQTAEERFEQLVREVVVEKR